MSVVAARPASRAAEGGRAAGFLEKQAGFLHLGPRNHPSVSDAGAILLRGQLRRGGNSSQSLESGPALAGPLLRWTEESSCGK